MANNDIQFKVYAQGSTMSVAGPNNTNVTETIPASILPHTKNGMLQVSDPLTKKTLNLAYREPSGNSPSELKAGREALIERGYQMQTIDTANGPKTVFVLPSDWQVYKGALNDLKSDHAKALKAASEQLKKIDGVKPGGASHPLFARPSSSDSKPADKPKPLEKSKSKAAAKEMAPFLAGMKAGLSAKPTPVAGKNPQQPPAGK